MQPTIPIIILALPLTMFLVLGLFGHKMSHRLAGILGTAGMGTTMVAAMAEGEVCHIANVGDSRAYHYQNGTLRQITRDHSYVAELVEQGLLRPEEARNHPRKNLITRAVGLNYRLKCDCFTVPFGSGDRVLLCSDGLSNVVEDEAMEQILRREEEPEGACRALLEAALEEGAPDNVTVLILSR